MKPFRAAFIVCCLLCAGPSFCTGIAERKPALPIEKNAAGNARAASESGIGSAESASQRDNEMQSAASDESASREGGDEKNGRGETTGGGQADDVKSPDAAQKEDGKAPEADDMESDAISRLFRDAEGKLKAFAFDAERFTLSDANGESVTVNASGKTAVRKTYDDRMRLVKRDVWKIASTAKESARESTETFCYTTDGSYPVSSLTEEEGRRAETFYDDKGRVISLAEFFVDKDGKKIPDTKMTRRYADGNKILEEEKSRWEYADEKKSQLVAVRVQKKTYDYAAGGENPDYRFYEDGTLRIKTIYAQNDAYVTTLYFDDGYTVISEYAGGKKTKETIKNGDRILRTKTYDAKK